MFASEAFALEVDQAIASHRSLFAGELAGLRGCIYHLGNKECETRGFFFGSELLSERYLDGDDGVLEFHTDVKLSVIALMGAVEAAPDTEYLLFLTDYQFGPTGAIRGQFPSLKAFGRAHDTGALRVNALYSIGRDG